MNWEQESCNSKPIYSLFRAAHFQTILSGDHRDMFSSFIYIISKSLKNDLMLSSSKNLFSIFSLKNKFGSISFPPFSIIFFIFCAIGRVKPKEQITAWFQHSYDFSNNSFCVFFLKIMQRKIRNNQICRIVIERKRIQHIKQ